MCDKKRPDKDEFARILNKLNKRVNREFHTSDIAYMAYKFMVDFYEQGDGSSSGSKLPEGESFVDMIRFQDKCIIASTKGIYEMVEGKMKPIPFEVKE